MRTHVFYANFFVLCNIQLSPCSTTWVLVKSKQVHRVMTHVEYMHTALMQRIFETGQSDLLVG